MDSTGPIAERIAGEHRLDTGITFTAAMRIKVENTLKRFEFGFDHPRGYRHCYRRSYGEGQLV